MDVWSSDGTSQGTGVVRDFACRVRARRPVPLILELTPFDTSLAFVLKADSGAQCLDARTGPLPVAASCWTDLSLPGTGNSYVAPYSLTVAGGHIYFISATPGETSGTVGLWSTKGTPASTAEIFSFSTLANSDPSQPAVVPTVTDLTAFGSILYVSLEYGQQTNGGSGNEYQLWTSDGTQAGTKEVPVAAAGSSLADLSGFMVLGGKLLFQATDDSGVAGLWSTDGTASGTTELQVLDQSVNLFEYYSASPNTVVNDGITISRPTTGSTARFSGRATARRPGLSSWT